MSCRVLRERSEQSHILREVLCWQRRAIWSWRRRVRVGRRRCPQQHLVDVLPVPLQQACSQYEHKSAQQTADSPCPSQILSSVVPTSLAQATKRCTLSTTALLRCASRATLVDLFTAFGGVERTRAICRAGLVAAEGGSWRCRPSAIRTRREERVKRR